MWKAVVFGVSAVVVMVMVFVAVPVATCEQAAEILLVGHAATEAGVARSRFSTALLSSAAMVSLSLGMLGSSS